MNQTEAQSLLAVLHPASKSTTEEKDMAYNRLSELFSLLLPKE